MPLVPLKRSVRNYRGYQLHLWNAVCSRSMLRSCASLSTAWLTLPNQDLACTQALTGARASPAAALAALEALFGSGAGSSGGKHGGSGRVTVLLVDEMDLLVTRKQSVSFTGVTRV